MPAAPISVQLWSVRDELEQLGWDAVMDTLAETGFTTVEPFAIADTLPLLASALARTGIRTPTVHGDLTGSELRRTLEAAAAAEATLVMHPSFEAARWHEPDGVSRIADDLAAAEALASEYGMQVAFHNHDDDLRVRSNGRPALVELMGRVGPGAGVELDPYWATIAGVDVMATIRDLGDKIFAVHLKDGPLDGSNEDQVAVGDGELDWDGLLRAVPAEVPRVIGLDMYAGPTLDAVIRSYRRLVVLTAQNDSASRDHR